MGTLINVAAIIVATILGMTFKRGLSEKIQKAMIFAIGLGLFVLSIGWFLSDFIVIENDTLSTRFDLLLLISLVVGTLIGTWIDIDDKINNFALKVEKKYNLPPMAKGFVTATLIFSVGAMSITGAIQDGLGQGMTILLVKSTLDFFTGMILASTLGIGVMFSAVVVLIYQGGITILASVLNDYASPDIIATISMIGNIILIAIAFNFMEIKKVKIANLLPALIMPVIYLLVIQLF
ncbi:DUF554 domain-containing protein [Mycoplasmatota bacterium]|nr:DUF554 domain-containing protein [Mycoplasmatota bacterium]